MNFDVVIAGGGIIGLSAAWRIAQRGLRVAVLDAGNMGGEASWAGAGMLAPGGEFREASPWLDFALESRRLYPAFVEELKDQTGGAIDFRESGAMELAFDEAERGELETRAARQAAIGIPSAAAAKGRFYPEDAIVNPRDVVRCLRQACLARGVLLRENEPVAAIHSGESVCVETARARYSAGAAILAAGAWSSSVAVLVHNRPAPAPRAFPVRGHLLGYSLPPGSVGPILRHGHTYILQRENGFTIAGSSSEEAGFHREIDPAIVADIHARARRIVPELENPTPWLGFRPATETLTPEIRRLPESRVFLAYGHYRNGILLAPATARRLAIMVSDADPSLRSA